MFYLQILTRMFIYFISSSKPNKNPIAKTLIRNSGKRLQSKSQQKLKTNFSNKKNNCKGPKLKTTIKKPNKKHHINLNKIAKNQRKKRKKNPNKKQC